MKYYKKFVTYWLISSNDNIFRIEDCLNENQYVDWQASFSPKIGDIVFIYRTKPIQRICYMMEVTAINIPYHNTLNDIKYWGEKHRPIVEASQHDNHRLKFLGKTDSLALHIDKLKTKGMKGVPQGPRKITGDLLEYILTVFNIDNIDNDFEELQEFEGLFEGAKKTIVVNQYERNVLARQKCISAHGYKCKVCGMDFEKTYGELGREFIHVHHIVPISTIGEEYQLDPVKDLVPVCPNCHAMLHRGINGRVLTVKELKDIITENRLII